MHTTTYEHDEAGNITRIVDPLGGITEQTYDALGRLATRTLPNGVTSTWTYDARGWTDTIVHRAADGDVIASVDYTRTASGEPERIDREDGSYMLYDYDSALRLSGEHYRDPGGAILTNIRYVYDADGNRTQRIVQEGPGAPSVVEDYAYSAGDLLETVSVEGVTTADYEYDTAGRVTSISDGATRTLGWDADDRVTSITEGPRTVHWTFDGDGRRVARTEDVAGLTDRELGYAIAPTLAESLESPHAITDGTGNETVGYVYAGEHPLFRYDPVTGEPVYYLQDGMGSVIGPETEVATIHYDGFGNERSTTGTLANLPAASAGDFRFQGMWLDSGTGLYYVRARVYEAGTGRFLSRDPAEGRRAGPETYWAYAFAGSHPTIARDPTGRFEVSISGQLATVGALATLTAVGISLPGLLTATADDLADELAERLRDARRALAAVSVAVALALRPPHGCVLMWAAAPPGGVIRRVATMPGGPRSPASGTTLDNYFYGVYFCVDSGPDASAAGGRGADSYGLVPDQYSAELWSGIRPPPTLVVNRGELEGAGFTRIGRVALGIGL